MVKRTRWKNLGQIFDCNLHRLPPESVGYAQSPQTLIRKDGIRFYFSTRRLDSNNGKFISQVAYVDYLTDPRQPDFNVRPHVSTHEILAPGQLGCYDEHGVFPFHIFKSGPYLYGYISGWSRRSSVSVETGIGISISYNEGETFERLGNGPILSASLHEPFLVGDPFVIRAGNQYHMWYIYGTQWKHFENSLQPERIYKIAHAISTDGVNWNREGKILIPDLLDDECQALPTVVKWGLKYHMFFCFRDAVGFRDDSKKGYRLGHAESNDLIDWNRDDSFLEDFRSGYSWDAEMQCYPHAAILGDRLYLFYNGNQFGRTGFGAAILEE